MKTAVLLRRYPPRATLLYGLAEKVVPLERGELALIASRKVVAYRLEHAGARRLFVFRTADRDAVAGARVPGVWPKVHLLASFDKRGAMVRVERLFAYLAKRQCPPSSLSDLFWIRVSHLLAGRLPRHKVLLSLLASEGQGHPADHRLRGIVTFHGERARLPFMHRRLSTPNHGGPLNERQQDDADCSRHSPKIGRRAPELLEQDRSRL